MNDEFHFESFIEKRFYPESLRRIEQALEILEEYRQRGYDLTLRQLYYQFVSRDFISNNVKSYNNLGSLVSDARLTGRLPWNAIEDRGRNLMGLPNYASPAALIRSMRHRYHIDLWDGQSERVEVWIEKDALSQIASRACSKFDVDYMACKGYMSISEMYDAAQRYDRLYRLYGIKTTIIHLGDHDPSGIDMTRDIRDRLGTLTKTTGMPLGTRPYKVQRIALSMDQIREYDAPPNPAKATDARFGKYQSEYGDESWELDALDPEVIENLITDQIEQHIGDGEMFEARRTAEWEGVALLAKTSAHWDAVVTMLKGKP